MTAKHETPEVKDLAEKAADAKKAAAASGAGDREKADSKLLEQEALGAKMRAKNPGSKNETKLDKALKDSFPASDPVSLAQPAPEQKP